MMEMRATRAAVALALAIAANGMANGAVIVATA